MLIKNYKKKMDYQISHKAYGEVEKKISSASGNENAGLIDNDPTMAYSVAVRNAAQAKKVVDVYLKLYGDKSNQHVSRVGNRLHMTPDGLSKLEVCAAMANVCIKPKNAKFIRR